MSLPAPYQEHYYVADGVTTSFSFGEYFTAPASANVKCIVYFEDGTSSVPAFTVDIVTGYINITALTTPDGQVLNAPPAGSSVRVFRDTPEQQNVTASQIQNYTAKQLEKIFDSIVAMIQEVSYSDKHKTLRLTETQRDVFLSFLKEANDDALLYWDDEARTIVPTDFVRQDVVRMSGGLFFRMKHDAELRPYLEWSINGQTDWHSLNWQSAKDVADEAKEIAEEARGIAQSAKDVADDAKDVADEAKQIAEGIDGKAQQALDNSVEALETAEEAKDMIQNQIIVRSAIIPTASADLVGKAYQYAGTTNGVYTHNYIYECQEIETNSYGWVRVDIQPNHEAQILALQADVSDIEALIPAQATPQNQLGDKAFINSSIATNTANFIGTFNSVAELEAYSGTVTNNDYAFVIGTDSAGNTTYNRYKYNANTQQWIYEYTLNNSSFTAAQWATINSGVTASDVSKARSAVQPSDLGNGTITITQGGTTMGSFTTNQSSDQTIALDGGGYRPDLFDHKWADHICNDVQWLRADTFSWQSGAVYQAAYAHLVLDIDGKTLQSETISGTTIQFYLADDGHKICPASEESNVIAIYNATGVAWYYIIDTTNQRLKLPRINPNKELLLSSAPVLAQAGSSTYNSKQVISHNISGSVVATGYALGNNGSGFSTPASYNEYTDLSNGTGSFSGKKYLYFYVGNFTQTALENTAGVTTEVLNDKVDKGHQVIAFQAPAAANNYTWYRKYADGWVEQGGTYGGSQNQVISLPVEMADNKYSLMLSFSTTSGNAPVYSSYAYRDKTTTSFVAINSGSINGDWQVSGMAAS